MDMVSAAWSPVPGRWYHLAYAFDDAADRHALYIDGVEVASAATAASIEYDEHPVLFGSDNDNGSPSSFFGGRADEVAIYGRPLAPEEI